MYLKIDNTIQLGVSKPEIRDAANQVWKVLEGMNVRDVKEVIGILEQHYLMELPISNLKEIVNSK